MTLEQLRTVHQAQPFRPFTIHMVDGRVFLIRHREFLFRHREFLSHSPTGRTVIVYQADDSFSILDIMLISELDVHAATQPEGGT